MSRGLFGAGEDRLGNISKRGDRYPDPMRTSRVGSTLFWRRPLLLWKDLNLAIHCAILNRRPPSPHAGSHWDRAMRTRMSIPVSMPISIAERFWQYAKEVILSGSAARTDEDRRGLLQLARIWTRAALQKQQCTPATTSVPEREMTSPYPLNFS
jgi:hypothetical protein